MTELRINTPRWALPLLDEARYKGAYGGRGGGKSQFFAELLVEEHTADQDQSSVCIREVQKSIKFSVKRLIEKKIHDLGVSDYFNITKDVIESRRGSGVIAFQGMQDHTAESIKSLEDFDRFYIEEAQSVSARSLELLRPTLRKEGSQIWCSWNPRYDTDPVDLLLRGANPPPNSIIVHVNYYDNPWFPSTLREEMEYDKGRDQDKFAHVWLGDYLRNSQSRVFNNWRVEDFESDREAEYRFGADWGFSIDPTVLIRCYIIGRKLFIDYEAYKVGCEIMDTPSLFLTVPESEKWPIVADGSRPETISHMRNHGFDKITSAVKGAKSVEEGIEWLKTFDIIVHPRCKKTIQELTMYSYKVDKMTDKVLPILEDKHNHVIDALRYACESARRLTKIETTTIDFQGWG